MQLCLPKTLPKLPSIINSARDLWNFRYIVSSHVGKQAGSFNSLSTFWRPSSSHTIKNFSNALDFVPHVTKMSKRQAWYAYARCKFESASVWIRDEVCFWQFSWEYFWVTKVTSACEFSNLMMSRLQKQAFLIVQTAQTEPFAATISANVDCAQMSKRAVYLVCRNSYFFINSPRPLFAQPRILQSTQIGERNYVHMAI